MDQLASLSEQLEARRRVKLTEPVWTGFALAWGFLLASATPVAILVLVGVLAGIL